MAARCGASRCRGRTASRATSSSAPTRWRAGSRSLTTVSSSAAWPTASPSASSRSMARTTPSPRTTRPAASPAPSTAARTASTPASGRRSPSSRRPKTSLPSGCAARATTPKTTPACSSPSIPPTAIRAIPARCTWTCSPHPARLLESQGLRQGRRPRPHPAHQRHPLHPRQRGPHPHRRARPCGRHALRLHRHS